MHRSTGMSYPLHGVVIVGRSPDCGLQLEDPAVSRRHGMIRQQDDGFWYFDLGSFNGTFLNDKRLVTAQKLNDGDALHISGHEFVFQQKGGNPALESDLLNASTMAQVRSAKAILLVTDIRGFTTLSEKLEPAVMARIMGSWYSFTEQILAQHGAMLDKFIGDCALAYWTDSCTDHRIQALRAAGAMQQSCIDTYAAHQEVLDAAGLTFAACASIHVGRVAYGGMSSREFTLIGDAVNVAFRVESLTRKLNEPVLVTADFLDGWEKGYSYCRPLGPQEVKGRKEPVTVFAVEKIPSVPSESSL